MVFRQLCFMVWNHDDGECVEDVLSGPRGMPLATRIRAARDLRGYTQQETVGLMQQPVSSAALSQIESAKVRPTDGTLDDLARALEVPVEFFFAQWPGGGPEGDSPLIYFRDLRATPSKERRRALSLALLLNDLVAVIEHYVRLPRVDIPTHPVDVRATRSAIEDVAMSVRREWGLGLDPIPHVVREIERHGVPVARLSMGHRKIDAFAVPFERRPIMLLTNDKQHNYARSRLDAAHELGHLVMHGGRGEQDRSIESQAHSFAASLLLPQAVGMQELPTRMDGTGWAKLADLKRRWGISLAALVRRARDLGRLSDDEYRNAMKFMSARGWRTQEPGDRELGPAESPLLMERALRTIEVQHGLMVDDLIDAAHLPANDTRALVEASHDSRPIVEF